MTDNLPPLPKGDITYYITDSTMRSMECDAHSDSQMQAYASAAIEADRAARGAVPAGWVPLTDGQWMNIVNLNQAWLGFSVEDAVHAAVKLTEARLKANNAASPQPQPVQPSEPDGWVLQEVRFDEAGIPFQVRDPVAQAKPEQAAQPNPIARRCYLMSEPHLSGHRLIIGFERLEDVQAAHALLAATSPNPKD